MYVVRHAHDASCDEPQLFGASPAFEPSAEDGLRKSAGSRLKTLPFQNAEPRGRPGPHLSS